MKKNQRNDLQAGAVPMGTIIAFALQTIPDGWLWCNGSKIPKMYNELRIALGSDFTPNLTGRTLIGTGKKKPSNEKQSDGTIPNFASSAKWPDALYTGGEYRHKLAVEELASHNHVLYNAYGEDGIQPNSTNWERANLTGDTDATSTTGGDLPHNNMQPYCTVNYIIYAVY